jgi:8-oxo-dGTP pyrophosphatase MutT (NUDIX family)
MDFGSHRKKYYVTEFGKRVGLLLLRRTSVLLVRQYRFVAGGATWEIPGGRIEPSEGPEVAAARECWEETGWKARKVRPLVSYIPGTDIIDNPTQICVGVATTHERRPTSRETQSSRWVPLRTCLEWVRRGRIRCGMTIVALCAYRSFYGSSKNR